MKTTIELPDDLFRETKATAARRGASLKDFVSEAIQEKLAREQSPSPDATRAKEWPVPPPDISREDADLIDKAIEEAFEQIDPEDWV